VTGGRWSLVGGWLLLAATAVVAAQQAPSSLSTPPRITAVDAQFDQASVDRGQQVFVNQCGFCHGSNARGGSSGPDLTRSELVQSDEGGKQFGEFLRAGRPDKGMPGFEQLSRAEVVDIATFLHAAIYLNANRRLYQVLNIVTGDARAGEAFFSGAGKCSACHQVSGDLKGVGAKYEPVALQQKFLMPRGGRGEGPPRPAYLDKNAIRVSVTLPSKQVVKGVLVRLTDFDVTVYDPETSQMRSFFRNGPGEKDGPKLDVVDPLQAHVDMWAKWTDADIHNMTAYLVSLK
jgi:cytochrome c oxidase cbb3-type subunit III